MTIILQHQFWGLNVTEQGFEVGLSFHKIPETLIIPYDALTGFSDPSVPFGMKFETEMGANDVDGPLEAAPEAPALRADGDKAGTSGSAATGLLPVTPAADASEPAEGKVISFDAFRKKT
jgi:hypothetical protein